jgi:Fur family transcriptional regulator, ferric uptake regulator
VRAVVTSLPPGTRLTAQRRTIVELVDGWEGGFTVAELHGRARRRDPRIGLATAYRTLELLRASGAVRILTVEGRPTYVRCHTGHHHHLVCTTCGSVEDTELCAAPPAEELTRRHGFTAEAHDLDIYGTCRRCA